MKPILQALLLADHVYQDRATGKFIIAGTFTKLMVAKTEPVQGDTPAPPVATETLVPFDDVRRSGSPYLYVNLTEVRGECPLQIRYVQLRTSQAMFEAELTIQGNDPLQSIQFTLPVPPLPREIGVYALELLYKDELLGSHRVTVERIVQNEG